eukprot:PhF_6_TR10024/c0_g1_i1/m.15350/K08869/ADCK, ABC1; aarF domain-containing kinase
MFRRPTTLLFCGGGGILVSCAAIGYRYYPTTITTTSVNAPTTTTIATTEHISIVPTSAFRSGIAIYEPYTKNVILRLIRNCLELLRMVLTLTPVVFYFVFRRSLVLDALYKAIIRLGPCYVKLAQWASTRPDLFGVDVVDKLKLMTYDAPRHTYEETMKRLTECGLTNAVTEISHDPIGSGCVAQVHTATLLQHNNSKKKVVLKVLHPHVYEDISVSLDLMSSVTSWVDWVAPHLALHDAVLEFASFMRSQLDLTNEAKNLVAFQQNFQDSPEVTFPTPYLELSTPSVLVESFEEGKTLDAYLSQRSQVSMSERKHLGNIGIRMFLKMIFIDNFIHGDLHPGNMLVRSDGKGLIVLDPGLTTSLLPEDREKFLELFSAVAAGDGRLGAKLMMEKAKWHNCTDEIRYLNDMDRIFAA